MQQPRQGSEIIRWAQSTLNLVLRLNLLVDGFMRPETRRAVRTFQRQKRLILDGIVGPSTKTALVAARQRYLPTRNKQNEFEEESFLDAVWDGFKKTARRSTPSNQALRNNIVKITRQEWERWQHGKVKEGSLRMRPILETYWRKGAGWLPKKEKWWSRAPWSAAFISWVMRKAGAGSDFRYSAAHATYVAAARENRLAKNSNPFKAYRISEVAPQPGDLVCKRRQKGVTYDNVRRGHRTHCDVVVSVKPGWIQTIGGNVSHSVKMTKVAVDGNGRVTDSRYFAIVKVG